MAIALQAGKDTAAALQFSKAAAVPAAEQ